MLCYILSLVSLLNQTYRTLMVLKDQEDPIYSLVSLAVSFEVERRMIAQNDPFDEAVHPRRKLFSQCFLVQKSLVRVSSSFRRCNLFIIAVELGINPCARHVVSTSPDPFLSGYEPAPMGQMFSPIWSGVSVDILLY